MTTRYLTNEEIQSMAPSAFAGQEYDRMSNRYTFVPTSVVIDGMRNAGYQPVQARQSIVRLADRRNFTKHLIRFQPENTSVVEVGDTTVQAVLVNSHDGSSAYELSLGAFRKVCSNGLMVSEGLVEAIHIRHTGNIINRVIEGTSNLLERAPEVVTAIQLWKSIELNPQEQVALANAGLRERFEEGDTLPKVERILSPIRYEDGKNDLWTVFNRIQENLVRGGVRTLNTTTGRRNRTREVKGIDQNNRLNRNLWALAQELAAIKQNS